MKPSKVYLLAAESILTVEKYGEHLGFSCTAISRIEDKVGNHTMFYGPCREVYKHTMNNFQLGNEDLGLYTNDFDSKNLESGKNERVLALLFMAEFAKDLE